MEKKYVCPLCGKSYSSAEELAKCVSKDAAAIKTKEEEISKKKEETKVLKDKLDSVKSEIVELNYKLRQKTNEFNIIGRKLASIDPKLAAHCSYSFSFGEEDSTVDAKEIAKNIDKILGYFDKNYEDKLNDLIDSIIF